MVAYELLHSMKFEHKGKLGSMAIKLDMSKTYDCVEWAFFEAMLMKLGFSAKWTNLLMGCVKSVSYSVPINGILGEEIVPFRGLRQGDPLSLYLFLICVEGLSSLLQAFELNRGIQGVVVHGGGVRINHLLFADDCAILCRAKIVEWERVLHVLNAYERVFGKTLNK